MKSLARENVLASYDQEGQVRYSDPIFPAIDILSNLSREQYEKEIAYRFALIRHEIIVQIRKLILAQTPIFSILSNEEVLVLNNGVNNSTPVYSNTENAKVISIEGPQGSGKSTQVSKVKQNLVDRGVIVADSLPKMADPARHIVDYENQNGVIMPFSARQQLARASLEARYMHGSNSGKYAVLDRSLFTAFNLHSTISRVHNVGIQDLKVDALALSDWWGRLHQGYKTSIFTLLNSNVVRSFFRMKKDQDVGNQKVDFVSQVLEHIYYRHLSNIGFAQAVEIGDKSIEEVSANITQKICVT